MKADASRLFDVSNLYLLFRPLCLMQSILDICIGLSANRHLAILNQFVADLNKPCLCLLKCGISAVSL